MTANRHGINLLYKGLFLSVVIMALPWAARGQNLKSYDQLIHLNYGDINQGLVPQAQEALDQALKQDCYNTKKKVGPYSSKFKVTYQCGEIPYGGVTGTAKSVFKFQIPKGRVLIRLKKDFTEAKSGEASVGAVTMKDSFKFDILLDRKQYAGRRNESLLDTKGVTGFDVKSTLGDTITLRHTPKGGALYSLVCGYLPGIKVKSSTSNVNIDANYTWRFLFLSATERLSVYNQIREGSLATRSAKLCGVVKTSVVKDSKGGTVPKIELLDITYPTFDGLSVKGPGVAKVDVKLHTLGLKIVNFVLTILRKDNIEKMVANFIQETVKTEVDKAIRLQVNDVKSGKFFETIIKDQLGKTMSKDIVASYAKALKESTEDIELNFTEDIEQQCTSLVKEYLKGADLLPYDAYVKKVCEGLQMDIALQPFVFHDPYSKKGCYAYPYSPVSYTAVKKNSWWTKDCALTSKIRVTAPASYIDLIQCLNSSTTQKQKMECALKIIDGLFDIPKEIADILPLIDSLEEIADFARKRGYSEKEIAALQARLSKLVKIAKK